MSSFRVGRMCALLFVLSTIACSEDGTRPDDEELSARVTVQVGTKGGTLKASGGMTLEIPKGALDKNIRITATNAGQTAPKEIQVKQVSDLYEFGPAGTKFNKDVKITFRTSKEEQNPVVYFTREDGDGFEEIASQKNGREVTAFVKHFSKGFVGVPLDDEVEPDAETASDLDAGDELDAGEELDAAHELDATAATDMDAADAPDAGAQPAEDASAMVADAGAPTDSGVDAASAPDATVQMRRVTVHSRDRYGALVNQHWAAYQEGQGAWRALPAPAQAGVYEFDLPANASFGVAFVCSEANLLNSWGSITFEPASTSMLTVVTRGPPCTVGAAPASANLSGSLTLTPDLYWRVGHALLTGGAGNYAGAPADFALNLQLGVADDVMFATGPMSPFMQINRILIRRDVVISGATTGFNNNMDAGVAPGGTATATATNANANTTVELRYATRNSDDGLLLNTTDPTGTANRSVSFATVPEGVRRGTDRYVLVATDSSSSQFRRASLRRYASGTMSTMLPPSFPTVFSSLDAPYLRPTFGFAPVADAGTYVFGSVYSPQRSQARSFEITVNPAWLTGTGQQTISFPDFSQVPGFQAAWAAPSGGEVDVKSAVLSSRSDAMGELKSESGQSTSLGAAL